MTGLFISYRRDDSQGYAGRLAGDLAASLGPEHVFSDVEIPPGSDFTEVLQRAVAGCDALLVVIGRRWAADSQRGYRSRLFEPNDWVRTEIEAALTQGKLLLPVLVGGCEMPSPADLPPSLAPLTRRQAATLGDRHWDADVAQLVARLRALLPTLAQPPAATGPATTERLLREIAERVRRQSEAGPPPPAPQDRAPSWVRGAGLALARAAGRGVKRVLTLALLAALVYGALRLFGDAATLRQLDAIEARLMIGWERLLRLLGGS